MVARVSDPATRIDQAFHALANPTRRAVISRLSLGPATVSELAEPFPMALPSFMQHVRLLEKCGLVATQKAGRVRTVRIRADNLELAAGWLAQQKSLWERRLDQFDAYVQTMEEPNDEASPDRPRTRPRARARRGGEP